MTGDQDTSSANKEDLLVWYYDVTDVWLWATRDRRYIHLSGCTDTEAEAWEAGRKAIRERNV